MNSITKRIIAIVMAMTCGVALLPGMAQALTLQEQIDALLAQIAILQAQLGTTGTTSGTGLCAGITFDRNLAQGMSGNDVKCLQSILNQAADTQVAASGVGSAGNESLYFGALTKAAVVKFQNKYASEVLTPIGLTAGTGYVGAQTRAKLNTMVGTTGTTPGTTDPGTGTLPTSAGLTVELASDNPAATTIISDGTTNVAGSQALIPFLKLKFSTPAGTTAKVTTLQVKRTGISTDTDLPNVYLYDGDTKVAEMTSMSTGVVTFSNAAGLFTVSGTKTLTVKADLQKDTTAGKTIGFQVVAATSIATDAETVNGTFPINGNVMTTAVVADFGRLSIASTTNSATVDPGTTAFEAMRLNFTATNQKIAIYSLKFLQLGSIAKTDIANMSLWVGGTQIGSTVASLDADGSVTFVMSTPYEIGSGVTRTISLKTDVIGGSTRTIKFSLQKSSDIVAMDTNYGVYVIPDNSTIATWGVFDSTQATVASGNLTISKATDSPSGNVALNSTNITLAKFNVKAVGENIKVSSLNIQVASSTNWDYIKNVKVYYDGLQIGTVQATMGIETNVTLNFTALVGQTKTLEIKADIQGGASFGNADKLTASVEAGTGSNAQRLTSLGTFNFPSSDTDGNALTVSTAGLTASKNYSVGNITAVYNAQSLTIGSWLLTAGAAEGVDVAKISFKDATSTATDAGTNSLGAAFTNLELYYGSTKLGSTVVPNTGDAAGTEYSFYPQGFSLAGDQTVTVTLKAGVLGAPTWSTGDAIQLSSVESTGQVTTNAANIDGGTATVGQTLTLTGAGVLTGAVESDPQTSIAAMGETGKTLGIWKLTANSTEELSVSQILLFNRASAAASANVNNLTVWCGSEQFGPAASGLVYASSVYYAGFGGTCVIPKGGSTLITLKGDITSYGSGAQAGQYLEFTMYVPTPITGVSSDEIIARGAGDYASTTARSTSTANRVYPYRTSLTAALAANGSASGRTRSTSDKVASLTLTGTAGANTLFRDSLDGDDEAVTSWATGTTAAGSSTVEISTTQKLDGTYSVLYQSTGTLGTSWAFVNAGTALNAYSKLEVWLYPSVTTAGTVFVTATDTATAYSGRIASTTTDTMAANKWNRIELSLADADADTVYIGYAMVTGSAYIDSIRAYNDSITLDIGGSATTGATSTPFYLKTTGGTEKAVGYYGNGKVVLIPSSEISIGATAQSFDVITDTTLLLVTDTTASETLSISSDLGTYTTAGDFRWYDQAVTATSPITWLNGTSPISVSLSY